MHIWSGKQNEKGKKKKHDNFAWIVLWLKLFDFQVDFLEFLVASLSFVLSFSLYHKDISLKTNETIENPQM